jgi:hypothetical protein
VFVSLRASFWCLRFVDPTDGSSSIGEFVLGSGEVVFSGEHSTIVAPRVSLFIHFPFAQGLPLPSLTLPAGGALPSTKGLLPLFRIDATEIW